MSSRNRGGSKNWRYKSNYRGRGARGRSTYTDRNTTNPADDGKDDSQPDSKGVSSPPQARKTNKSKRSGKKNKQNAGIRRQSNAPRTHPILSGKQIITREGVTISDLKIVAVDYSKRRPIFYSPTFGPLEEAYALIKPRMDTYYLDFMRGRNSGQHDNNYRLFYQNFAFRLSELYLAKLWLFNSPNRLLDANFAKIRELLVVKFPVIKEFFSDVSSFIGDFILFKQKWVNRLPLVIIAHHWLQAGYGKITSDYHCNNFHGLGCNLKQYGDLPILLTPILAWPYSPAQLGGQNDADGNVITYPRWLLDRGIQDGIIRSSKLLNPRVVDIIHTDYRKCSFYLFNCMICPAHTWLDYFRFPSHQGVDPRQIDFYRNPDVHEEVFLIPHQPENYLDTSSMFLRMFPWRNSFRQNSPFIIQFNCHFIKHFGLDTRAKVGIEDYTPSISRSLAYLIGGEIDDYMQREGLVWYFNAGMEIELFLSKLDSVTDVNVLRDILVGNIRTVYYDENHEAVIKPLSLRLLYKLPLYFHAIVDAHELDNMDGFLHLIEEATNGIPHPPFRNRYNIARHWWRWCMAGILPRWVPAKVMNSRVSGHFDWARDKIQLDFLRKNVRVEDYNVPSFSGSPLQLSFLFEEDECENLFCAHKCTPAEASSGFIVTDRICTLGDRFRLDIIESFPYRFCIQGDGEKRKINDLTASYFPQDIWSVKGQR